MARNTQAEAVEPQTAEQTAPADPGVVAATREEWGQYVASQDIYVGTALAYIKGDPVPAANVAAHGYDEAGLVEKVK